MSHWTYLDEKRPPHSGQYLVVARLESRKGNLVFLSDWDEKHNQFSFDKLMQEKDEAIRIHAWLDIPPAPLHKASLLGKQEKQL